ncbi:MAG: membrane protein insertase YidC [Alphaproteobacteria bacterium]|nr:membrane protein insertase YidC [Alphaproteobacteria bacterium]
MKEEVKGLYLAIFLSAVAILAVNWIWPVQEVVVEEKPVAEIKSEKNRKENVSLSSDDKLYTPSNRKIENVADALKQDKRISIKNSKLSGSIRLRGARFDNLNLSNYKKTLDENSPAVELLMPSGTTTPYYAEFGWLSNDSTIKLPNSDTMWKVIGKELTPETPLTLEWNNGAGIKFVRRISMDKDYMFGIEQIVENNSGKDIKLYPYGMVNRVYTADGNTAVVHEGMLGVVDGSLKEIKSKDLDEGEKKEYTTKGGWAGFGERYWFSAFTLNNSDESTVRFTKTAKDTYQSDFVSSPIDIANGAVATSKTQFYAGAKEIALLDKYAKTHDIQKFDLAVDFGWYYFLTKPFFYILDFLYKMIGNMGWAILVFAALLRLVMFPVANKSYESMSKMKKVQPKIQAIQEAYKNDKIRLQQEMMELYKKEKINPASGCLPMFIQIPVFFSLYKVLNIAIEIRHAEFIGWIKDLSAPDPMTLSYMTGIGVPSFFDLGVWPMLMGLTMYLQQKMSPKPANKDQARMFALMPIFFMFMLGHFASGLVIYWTLSNVLSIIQQKAIMKKVGA